MGPGWKRKQRGLRRRAVTAQQDASFQAIKAKLLKKPHKNSRLWKEGA